MEAYLFYFAGACFGVFFISLVVAFLTKPYRQRKIKQSGNKEAVNNAGIIRARLVVHKLKLPVLNGKQSGSMNRRKSTNQKAKYHLNTLSSFCYCYFPLVSNGAI